MNKITINSAISILFISFTLLVAKTTEPSEDIDENYILNNIDTNSMGENWKDYHMYDNNIEEDNTSIVGFEDKRNFIGQPECSIEPSN